MKRKGFTIIELLAVIVVLAIIALIVTPMIMTTINSAREGSVKASILNIIDSVETKASTMLINDSNFLGVTYSIFNGVLSNGSDVLEVKGKLPTAGNITYNADGSVELSFWDDTTKSCFVKKVTDETVSKKGVSEEGDCLNSIGDLKPTDSNYSCYTFDSTTGIITGYDENKCGTDFVVPNKINGIYVTGFSNYFSTPTNVDKITSFTMSGVDKVSSFPDFFFQDTNLNKVIITNDKNLKSISNGSFKKTAFQEEQITDEIIISNCDNLETINNSAYYNTNVYNFVVTNLKSLTKFEVYNLGKLHNVLVSNFLSIKELYNVFTSAKDDNGVSIEISNMPVIEKISVFYSIKKLNNFKIYNLPKLKEFSGFTALKNGKDIKFSDLPELESLEGFYDTSCDSLELSNMPALKTLTGFTNGNISVQNVTIYNLENLTNSALFYNSNIKNLTIINVKKLTGFDKTNISGIAVLDNINLFDSAFILVNINNLKINNFVTTLDGSSSYFLNNSVINTLDFSESNIVNISNILADSTVQKIILPATLNTLDLSATNFSKTESIEVKGSNPTRFNTQLTSWGVKASALPK